MVEGDVHRGRGGMGARPLGCLVRNGYQSLMLTGNDLLHLFSEGA